MTNRWNWMRTGLAAVLALSLFGSPQLAAARDRYDNRIDYENSYYRDRDQGYRDYRDDGYYGRDDYRYRRSPGRSAAIIGGSAAAGAVVGGIAGGGRGAAIGAAVGGIGGLIFDRATKKDRRDREYMR
jgi:hypothetical protein